MPGDRRKAVIGDLHQLQCRLIIRCRSCGHHVTHTPSQAVAAFGWNRRVQDLRARLACASCGARRDQLEMGLHDADRHAMWKREGLNEPHPEDVKTRSPGANTNPQRTRHNRMSWQGNLGQMKACGTIVCSTCSECRKHYEEVDLDQLISLMGPDGDLWDRWSTCPTPACPGPAFFIASPGRGTPMRPLMTSLVLNPWVGEAVEIGGVKAARRKTS